MQCGKHISRKQAQENGGACLVQTGANNTFGKIENFLYRNYISTGLSNTSNMDRNVGKSSLTLLESDLLCNMTRLLKNVSI